jgi:hypothetical protein
VTVGTGIGGGSARAGMGRLLHGALPPRNRTPALAGVARATKQQHVSVPPHCFEGLASGDGHRAPAWTIGHPGGSAGTGGAGGRLPRGSGGDAGTRLGATPHRARRRRHVDAGAARAGLGVHARDPWGYGPSIARNADYVAAPHFADSGLEGALMLARAARHAR